MLGQKNKLTTSGRCQAISPVGCEKTAPCQPSGEVNSEGQEESKEATCKCSNNPSGCCVDGQNRIIPLQLKE